MRKKTVPKKKATTPKPSHTFKREKIMPPKMTTPKPGRKFDETKTRYDLFTEEALEQIGQVLTYGSTKYGDRNWERGINYGRVFAATMRHLWKFWRGEQNDPKSGLSHLAHAGCNIVFLLTYEARGMGAAWDDRQSS